jgi:hypothetical protein
VHLHKKIGFWSDFFSDLQSGGVAVLLIDWLLFVNPALASSEAKHRLLEFKAIEDAVRAARMTPFLLKFMKVQPGGYYC